MGADYYVATTANGDRIDDPSEDALFMLLSDLNDGDNRFLVVNPAREGLAWWASVTRAQGGFEVVRFDPACQQNEVTAEQDLDRIANGLTIWLAGRDFRIGGTRTLPGLAGFTLTTERAGTYTDPDERRVEWAVARLNDDNFFVTLTRADGWFVQVGYGTTAGVASGTYVMEFREGSADAHFANHTTDIHAATRFMLEFHAGVDTWNNATPGAGSECDGS